MKTTLSFVLSCMVFLASFQNSLVLVDYQIHRDYYEALCINKDKPDLQCNGKCQVKKEVEKNTPQTEQMKLSFEFNILPAKNIEIPNPETKFTQEEQTVFYNSAENILKGFHKILPHPPQNLI